jgi:lactate dehydrogenase-like 2-hydroxyacid dehydrogenase
MEKVNQHLVVLDTDTLGNCPNLPELYSLVPTTVYGQTKTEEVPERIQNASAIITNKVVISSAIIEASPKLAYIGVAATGMNNIDLVAAKKRGIQVTNVAGYSTNGVAQHTLALALSLWQRLSFLHHKVQSGEYAASGMFTCLEKPFQDLEGKTWGIIGLGTIGHQVAKLAEALGCKVVYHSVSGTKQNVTWRHLELNELLSQSDLVSLHLPLSLASKNLISAKTFSFFKKAAILVNTARGGIVNEVDLIKALNEGLLSAAALDVFETEPLPADSPLLQIQDPDKLLLSPHVAWASEESRFRLVEGLIHNFKTWLANSYTSF